MSELEEIKAALEKQGFPRENCTIKVQSSPYTGGVHLITDATILTITHNGILVQDPKTQDGDHVCFYPWSRILWFKFIR